MRQLRYVAEVLDVGVELVAKTVSAVFADLDVDVENIFDRFRAAIFVCRFVNGAVVTASPGQDGVPEAGNAALHRPHLDR